MIIVEGPDGSGKSTFCDRLSRYLDWPIANRVVDKNTNAMVDLTAWTKANVSKGFQGTIFDRHRLISEPIYGPIMRKAQAQRELYKVDWLDEMLGRFLQCNPIIVFCMPPFEKVVNNVAQDPDNVAVCSKIDAIYRGYASAIPLWSRLVASTFPYDYSNAKLDDTEVLLASIRGKAHYRLHQLRSTK